MQLFDIVVKVKLVKFPMLVLPSISLVTTQLLFDFIYYRFVIFLHFAYSRPQETEMTKSRRRRRRVMGGLSTLEADGVSSFGNKY